MRLGLLFVVVLVALGAGCPGGDGTCTDDSQCDPTGQGYVTCNVAEGFCVCVDDRGCGPNEVCNAAGRCQLESGCQTNDECGTDLFCDTVQQQCLSVVECSPQDGEVCCTLDAQCPFGNVCDPLQLKCVAGCRVDGDCRLGDGCSGSGPGRLGQCGSFCSGDNQCDFGELCNVIEGECVPDTRGPYCDGCTGGVASDDCGDFGNYCLTDTVNGGEFCGVDCHLGEACPFGFNCNDVIIIPPAAPFCQFPEDCILPVGGGTGTCARTGGACNVPEDCAEGPPFGDCRQRTGRGGSCQLDSLINCERDSDCPDGPCVIMECRGGEGQAFGNCSCTRDADCPNDRCLDADNSNPNAPIIGHCELSGHECLFDVDCDTITCVDGGCLIGQNCAPSNDRTCRDLLP